ncbi:MAG: VOC family protein, partial [Pseudomonadota bacterium]
SPAFVWCDLSAYDTGQAARFYSDLLGWSLSGEGDATTATGDPVASIYAMPETFRDMGMPSFWMSYIAVPSVEDCVAKARTTGGKVEVEESYGPDGQIALIRDPLGAGFTIYEGPMRAGASDHAEAGTRAGHALLVSSADAVAPFYTEMFGWLPVRQGDHLVAFVDDSGRQHAELHTVPSDDRGGFEYWAIAFTVNDLDAAADHVRANRGSVFGQGQLQSGRSLSVADGDGAAFHLIARGQKR